MCSVLALAAAAGTRQAFILENVPALVTLDGGTAFAVILAELAAAGYTTCWKVVDAAGWLPQVRHRRSKQRQRCRCFPRPATAD